MSRSQTIGRRRPMRWAAGGVVLGLLMLAAPATTLAATSVASGNSSLIPVLGRTTITAGNKEGGTRATVLVHGVRRIPKGTVLYYSIGAPAGATDTTWLNLSRLSQVRQYSLVTGSLVASQYLVDVKGKRVYTVLIDSRRAALASPAAALGQNQNLTGQFQVLYEVLPELPADLTTVEVQVGNGDVIPSVPVTDGPMEPAIDQTGPIALGQGWPKVDPAVVAAVPDPASSIYSLHTEVSDVEKTVVNRDTDDSASVDLSADVLFAVDSAKLAPRAQSAVAKAAAQINQRSAGGRIQIVGHTDSTGTPAHNQTLSLERARSVAAALKPLVTVPGVSFVESGRGEKDPVRDNGTAAGRKENRRVSIVFTPKEGQ